VHCLSVRHEGLLFQAKPVRCTTPTMPHMALV
jgi:hypothetical protein